MQVEPMQTLTLKTKTQLQLACWLEAKQVIHVVHDIHTKFKAANSILLSVKYFQTQTININTKNAPIIGISRLSAVFL